MPKQDKVKRDGVINSQTLTLQLFVLLLLYLAQDESLQCSTRDAHMVHIVD